MSALDSSALESIHPSFLRSKTRPNNRVDLGYLLNLDLLSIKHLREEALFLLLLVCGSVAQALYKRNTVAFKMDLNKLR